MHASEFNVEKFVDIIEKEIALRKQSEENRKKLVLIFAMMEVPMLLNTLIVRMKLALCSKRW